MKLYVCTKHYPASSPELNPAENAQNMLKHTVIPDLLKREGIEWDGNAKNKMSIVTRAIDTLSDGVTYPNYFKNLFNSLKRRYRWVADNNGKLLTN